MMRKRLLHALLGLLLLLTLAAPGMGALAADAVSEAILRAVRSARSAYGYPAAGDLEK